MRVSVIQIDVCTGDVAENQRRVYRHLQEAARRRSDLVVLPEMWSTGFAYDDFLHRAREAFQPTMRFLRDVAQEGQCAIASTIPEPVEDGVFNTFFWVEPGGGLAGSYRKAHLFSPMHEDEHFLAGDRIEPIQTGLGVFGPLICYDLRFPEAARSLAVQDAACLVVPAQFPHPREAHWWLLLQARAIENQVWVIGANRVGSSGKFEFFGGSRIIDPWGEIVEGAGTEPGVITADIDLQAVETVRRRLPALDRRRPHLYGALGMGSQDPNPGR